MSSEVPITGVVGVVGGPGPEARSSIDRLSDARGVRPHAVEIRADLFEDPGDGLDALSRLPRDLGAIFTVRLRGAGGRYAGSESERLRLYREALGRGAKLVDAETGTEAARELARVGAPLVASHHDFERTPDDASIERLAAELESLRPRVAKLVPTAVGTRDALRILRWVRARGSGGPARVGFAMGPAGVPSRVLALAWGSAWTYGALGEAAAPGMPSVEDLLQVYRAHRLSARTRIVALAGSPAGSPELVRLVNRALASRGLDAVCIPFEIREPDEIAAIAEDLPVDVVGVAPELSELALLAAHDEDRTARAARGADALRIDRGGSRPGIYACHRSPPDAPPAARAFDLVCHLLGREPDPEGLAAFRAEVESTDTGASGRS